MNSRRLAVRPDSGERNRRSAGWSSWSPRRLTLLMLLMTPSCSPSARAQMSASIKGTVTDPSGAPVPSATAKAKNLETGAIRSGITDGAGRFLAVSLPVGEYEIRVTKLGFQDAIRSGIHLVVGEEANIDLRLQVGPVKSK